MQVEALDHVNIITGQLDVSAGFYAEVLGLERRFAPPPLTADNAAWMYDGGGRAIIHINTVDAPKTYERPAVPGELTGALHHVALRVSGYEELKARLDARGADYRENVVEAIGLRQIFTADPNNVLLELNFFGG